MAFSKKTWLDRIAEYPTRRRLKKSDGTDEIVSVSREEGAISQEGDAFSAANMNDLEDRVASEFNSLNINMTRHWKKADNSNVEWLGLTYNADAYNPDGIRGAFEIWLNFLDNTKAVLGFNDAHIWFNYFINDQWFTRWVK